MGKRVLFRRLSLLGFVAALSLICYGGTALAGGSLLWYDGFVIDADDGAGPNYVEGTLAGQQGGSDAGSGIGFFDDAMGNPNPWLGVNNTDPADQDNVLSVGSLMRGGAPNPPSTGDKASDQPAEGCCNVARTSRDMNAPLQTMDGTIYMGFLVNFGLGNPADPHYRAIEFWNGKSTIAEIEDPDQPGSGIMVPNPNFGRVGDDQLTMALGISSFGNFNGAVNQGGDPDPNTQISLKVKGVRENFGSVVETNHQLEDHVEWADQLNQTHSIVLKFDLSTNDIEVPGGVGDTVSVFLDPTPADVVEPTPSLVVPGVDLNIDSMSAMILFTFSQTRARNPGAFDELRVGTTWSDVAILGVPEPATCSLLALGALGFLVPARRRRA